MKDDMKMALPYAYEKHNDDQHAWHVDPNLFIIVRRSKCKVIKILAQALLLALVIMFLPSLRDSFAQIFTGTQNDLVEPPHESLPVVLHDLTNEGLFTKEGNSLIVSHNVADLHDNLDINDDIDVMINSSDSERQSSLASEMFDFSFIENFIHMREFVDRTLKQGGIVAMHLSRDPMLAFDVPPNYKLVYFKKYDSASPCIALRKLSNNASPEELMRTTTTTTTKTSATQRKLLEFLSEEKKAVLGGLEDVLLEPPRSATGKSRAYFRKTKFLPDLLNDNLEGYSRRVYIDVGGGHGSTRWFEQNYPTRNKDFDIYRIETVPDSEVEREDDAWEGPPTQMGISDWLWRNVKTEEYVVMKADAEVVEEMLKSKAIVLVDELFLECKPFGKGGKSKRAYWECLALYGRLRDIGVVVHQWWG